jgi:hypothetical protein
MIDELLLLIRSLILVIIVGVGLVSIIYTSYIFIPLLVLSIIAVIIYQVLKAKRGY